MLPLQRSRTQRPLFRPSVGARVRRPPKLVLIGSLSIISENDLRKIQYLSAGIVKTLSLSIIFLRIVMNPIFPSSYFLEFKHISATIIMFLNEFQHISVKIITFVDEFQNLPMIIIFFMNFNIS